MAVFRITLRTKAEDDDGIRLLRAALKLLLRRFGLRAIKVEQTPDLGQGVRRTHAQILCDF